MTCKPRLSKSNVSNPIADAPIVAPNRETAANIYTLERRAGLQPATPSLEGSCSDASELPALKPSIISPTFDQIIEVLLAVCAPPSIPQMTALGGRSNREDSLPPKKSPCCKNCGVPIGEITDPWGGKHGWTHRYEDGPDAYYFCHNDEGEAEPEESEAA